MKQLIRTTDIVTISHIQAILDAEGIATFELDVNMSVLDGSLGILPRRIMVADDEYDDAVQLITDAGLAMELSE
ncbi:DUF2007 domain-containing protein [Rhodobacteraceae bacterium]|jgi:hypothetical protein|nr:DUF2007 domain-containing protein [Paracoccaceae bacterium]NBQ26618.1 DUF2007 domain-containing protein [Paracoccaceae bacterium]